MSIFTNASAPWAPLPTPWRRGPSGGPWSSPSWTRIPGRAWNCSSIARTEQRPCITTCNHHHYWPPCMTVIMAFESLIWFQVQFNKIFLISCSQLCINIKIICNSSFQRQFDAFSNIYVCRFCINKYVLKRFSINIGTLHTSLVTRCRDRRSIKLFVTLWVN